MILAIDKEFLTSILPELIQGFRLNSFESTPILESRFEKQLESQAESFSQNSDTYPVVLKIHGAIVKKTNWNYIGTQTFARWVKQLDAHPDVSAIIFDIDSGGGMVSGTAEFANVIRNCQKPTIAYTNGYMCSAAYHIAAACDKVVANPFADYIGSIGTMLHAQDFSAMFEKWGAKIYELYAPQSSEKNKIWRDLQSGDNTSAQEHLSVLADNFIKTMKAYRPQIKDDEKVFKGGVYAPEKALEVGLIDEIMTLEQILNEF